MSVHRPRRCE